MHTVAVIGAGVIGLASAVNIQNKLPEAKVRIIADRLDQDTTSWGAGGIFRPTAKHLHGVDLKRIRKWLRDGWDFYSSLATSEHAGESGMQIVSGYILYKEEPEGLLYPELVYSHRQMSQKEMNQLKFGQYRYGYDVTTIITTPKYYYKWMLKRFLEKGGEIEQRKVSDLNEFVGTYDIVVNCTGLGSKDLIGDNSVYPIRGQLVRVRAPWIKKFVYTDDDTYIYPNADLLALGGCRQKDNYNLSNTQEDTDRILEGCHKILPALKGAQIDHVWTGLRPTRESPRVEKETVNFPNGNLKVVHNYGHGANGITLSWGVGMEAADLVVSFLKVKSKL